MHMAYMNMGEGLNRSVLGTSGSACQWSMRQNPLQFPVHVQGQGSWLPIASHDYGVEFHQEFNGHGLRYMTHVLLSFNFSPSP